MPLFSGLFSGSPRPRKASVAAQSAPGDVSFPAFTTAWTGVKNVLQSPQLRHEAVEATPLQSNLDLMLDCLAIEGNIMGSGSAAAGNGGPTGECLEYFLKTDIPAQLVSLSLPDQPIGIKGLTIAFFSSLIVLMDEHFVVHSKVHKPLVRLLRSCVEPDQVDWDDPVDGQSGKENTGWKTKDTAYELGVVEMMCHLCSRIKTFPELLALFLHEKSRPASVSWPPSPTNASPGSGAVIIPTPKKTVHFHDFSASDNGTANTTTTPHATPPREHVNTKSQTPSVVTSSASASGTKSRTPDSDMLIFSYLLRFVHREGKVGDLARAGLLFLMEIAMGRLSTKDNGRPGTGGVGEETIRYLGEWILDGDFADVLAAGIGAAYGLLPRKLRLKHNSGPEADGMVLGEGEDEDWSESRLDEVVESDDVEFRCQLDLYGKLLEFAQDVLGRASNVPIVDINLRSTPDLQSTTSIASSIAVSVLSSLRRFFLSAILYPSLLESSSADGSAVAVLSYLDVTLNKLDPDGRLAGTVLRHLLTDEEDGESLIRHVRGRKPTLLMAPPPTTTGESTKAKKLRRRQSGVLQLIKTDLPAPPSAGADAYFSSLGKFTLRDLITDGLHAPHQATAAAALQLLMTILTRHDRYALVLLEVTPDQTATAFPFPSTALQFELGAIKESDLEEESEEEFHYPTPGDVTAISATLSTPHRLDHRHLSADITFANQLLSSPAPTYKAHQDEVNAFTGLLASLSPSQVIELETPAYSGSTEYEKYLVDAEYSVAGTPGYRRGLDQIVSTTTTDDLITSLPSPAESVSKSLTSDGRMMELVEMPCVRHILPVDRKVMTALLESLAHFFAHSPSVNLALTGCVAALASDPTRSLEGWLVPKQLGRSEGPLDAFIEKQQGLRQVDDDGDDRSIDFAIDEFSRYLGNDQPLHRDIDIDEDAAVLSIYRQLADQVEFHRSHIQHFDKYLKQRRQGLLFVETLADALEGRDFLSLGDFTHVAAPPAPPLPVEFGTPQLGVKDSIAAFFTPTKTPTMNKKVTTSVVNKQQLQPNVSSPESGSKNKLSPFAGHYETTRSIHVTPKVALTPASRRTIIQSNQRSNASSSLDSHDDEESDPGFQIETPTKKTFSSTHKHMSGTVTFPSSQQRVTSQVEDDDQGVSRDDEEKEQGQGIVSLSQLLDNIVILEEHTKELAAILSTRRTLGIDQVRFI